MIQDNMKEELEDVYDAAMLNQLKTKGLYNNTFSILTLPGMRYNVITLCGSTKFKDDFLAQQKKLTLQGNVVITVGLFGHSGDDLVWTEGTKQMLDSIHLQKIEMADEIFIINKNGYIGLSTKKLILYATKLNKIITYME